MTTKPTTCRPTSPRPVSRHAHAPQAPAVHRGSARDNRSEVRDPLALRSAAIEEALRTGGDAPRPRRTTPSRSRTRFAGRNSPTEPDDDYRSTSWSWDHDEPEPDSTIRQPDAEDSRESGASEFLGDDTGEDEPRRSARRSWTAFLGDLDMRTRVRILIGAIAGLGVILAVLAAFIVSSLLSGSGSPPQVAAPAIVPSTSGARRRQRRPRRRRTRSRPLPSLTAPTRPSSRAPRATRSASTSPARSRASPHRRPTPACASSSVPAFRTGFPGMPCG